MATVGQALATPETGWKRYDDADSRIIYDKNTEWISTSTSGYYNNTRHYKPFGGTDSFVKFKFKGTKIRIIGLINDSYSNSIAIKIDGNSEKFSSFGSSAILQALLYEKNGISDDIHTVEIDGLTSNTGNFLLDAIDIDDTGYLVHPTLTEKTSLEDLEIGDCIPCRYKATSGAVGTFSELGTCVASGIPTAGSATPDGLFYFIKADSGLLIADRCVQHSISWDALNTGGYIEGKKVNLGQDVLIRSLSGGVAYADANGNFSATNLQLGAFPVDNEFDKYIRTGTLNSKITAGDNNIWNGLDIYSMCKETPPSIPLYSTTGATVTPTNTVRIRRRLMIDETGWGSYGTLASSSATQVNTGFRPVLQYIDPKLPENKRPTTLWY